MKANDVLEKVLKGKRLAPNSAKWYRSCFRSWCKYSEDFPTEGWQVNEWVAQLEGWNDVTILKHWKLLKAANNYMIKISGRDEYGRAKFPDAFLDCETPKVQHKRRRYFSPDELYKVVKACQTREERCLILTLIDSGARISEVTWLKYEDIGEGFFNVKGGYGRSKTGERRYRLDKNLCNELRQLSGGFGKVVFKRVNGEPYNDASDLSHKCRKIFIRAGLTGKKLGAHTLRHSVGTMIAKVTGSDLAVKAVLQHDKVETSHLYMHEVEDYLADKVSPLQMLGGMYGHDENTVSEQLMLTDGSEKAEVMGSDVAVAVKEVDEFGMTIIEQDLVSDMFIEVPEDVSIRPMLKTKDLKLIRDITVEFTRVNPNDSRTYAMQELLKRMLRKV